MSTKQSVWRVILKVAIAVVTTVVRVIRNNKKQKEE
ncbi:DUF6486 family protein [Bacteroides sp. UBA939]